ncbi:hypothetical protein ASD50_21065 [Mesorhizobium sp. Root552]|jgi:hypothetical protein|nr:hypothetical protein ASD50_21065 [Mesorhizobium sp. Root552]
MPRTSKGRLQIVAIVLSVVLRRVLFERLRAIGGPAKPRFGVCAVLVVGRIFQVLITIERIEQPYRPLYRRGDAHAVMNGEG